jgi:hypothetical protein
MSRVHQFPDRFSDIAGVSDCQKFRGALLLMRRVASAAKERIPGRNEQSEKGVAAVVRFTEMADEFLSSMKKRVEEEIAYGRQYGFQVKPSAESVKSRLPKQLEGTLFMGIYRIQYELACMSMPPTESGEPNGMRIYRISERFRASNDTSEELGRFLDSIGLARGEYGGAVETLRGFFMSQSDTNVQIKEDKARVTTIFLGFMESYVDFRFGGPLEEGARR